MDRFLSLSDIITCFLLPYMFMHLGLRVGWGAGTLSSSCVEDEP